MIRPFYDERDELYVSMLSKEYSTSFYIDLYSIFGLENFYLYLNVFCGRDLPPCSKLKRYQTYLSVYHEVSEKSFETVADKYDEYPSKIEDMVDRVSGILSDPIPVDDDRFKKSFEEFEDQREGD